MNSYTIPRIFSISPLKDGLFACHHAQAHKTTLLSYDGSTKAIDLIKNNRTSKRSFTTWNLVGIFPPDVEGKITALFRYDPTIDAQVSDDDDADTLLSVPVVEWSKEQFLDMIKLGGDKTFGSLRICLATLFLQKDFPEIPSLEIKTIRCGSCGLIHNEDSEPPKKNKICIHDWLVDTYSRKYNSRFDFMTFWCGRPDEIQNLSTHLKQHPPEKIVLLNHNTNSKDNNFLLFGKGLGDKAINLFFKAPRQASFEPNGNRLAITHKEGVSILCSSTGHILQTFELENMRAVSWSYDGLTLAVANHKEVVILDME